jgi:hypothetical protein
MNAPDAKLYRPEAAYARQLFEATGLTVIDAADRIGVSRRTFQYYISTDGKMPYTAQYTLEALVETEKAKREQ